MWFVPGRRPQSYSYFGRGMGSRGYNPPVGISPELISESILLEKVTLVKQTQ
jgi:hypothetical protein